MGTWSIQFFRYAWLLAGLSSESAYWDTDGSHHVCSNWLRSLSARLAAQVMVALSCSAWAMSARSYSPRM